MQATICYLEAPKVAWLCYPAHDGWTTKLVTLLLVH